MVDQVAEDLLGAIRAELGYKEKADQLTKFGEWYARSVGDPKYKKAPWCDMFISWAADRAGVTDYVGSFAWTPSHARWFERQGAWSDTPEPGALVFYDWSGSKDIRKIDHVGVVERVEGARLHTIEANVDGKWLKRKVRDEDKVVGYGLPRKVQENQAAATSLAAAGGDGARGAAAGAMAAAAPVGGALGPEQILVGAASATGVTAAVLLSLLALARRRPAAGRHRRAGG
ncbi:hypothetical protein Sru01_15620 [Sphaerisporangium rufum]|uniref:Peptidase C51 domain-containing protein n=1 Tax=Sphaerisporangium rufum TaxID=1381558 RepID=A0A919R3S2_9ACTN|nr:CHAP domain-containing protein [Sphaerisporangium rufum]GII76580.1 hypothetical protein Sru01_15620 [Sphaerisporangium rufum]